MAPRSLSFRMIVTRTRILLTVSLLSLTVRASHGAPPVLTSLAPRGVERGKPVEVVVTGANLTQQTQLWLPFPAAVKPIPEAKPNPALLKFQVTAEASVPVGVYPARLFNDEGVSGLAFFCVDAFPEGAEIEPNDSFDKAQKVPFPVVINGSCAGGDVDHFQFFAKKGQRVVVETVTARIGSGVVPQIRVTDEKGRFLGADDSQKLRGDVRVAFTAPADGAYVVEFSDTRYRGGNPPNYRLKIAEYDFAEEIFPLGGKRGAPTEFTFRSGNLPADAKVLQPLTPFYPGWISPETRLLDALTTLKAGMSAPEVALGDHPEILAKTADKGPEPVSPPLTINGRLETKGTVHRFTFPAKEGQRWRLSVEAESLGSYLDGVLKLTDQAGKPLAQADDIDLPAAAPGQQGTKTADPSLEYVVAKGVTALGVELRDGRYRGGVNFGYRLSIEPAESDFAVRQPIAELNVPRGGVAVVNVGITRRGYTKPIQLGVTGLPAGWAIQGGYVSEGASAGIFTVKSPPLDKTGPGPTLWRIEARGLDDKALVRYGDQRIVLSRDGNVAASTIRLGNFAVGLTGADPIALQGPPNVDIVLGYPAQVPITLTWNLPKDQKPAPVEVLGQVPSEGGKPAPLAVTVKPAAVAPGMNQAMLTVTAPVTLKEGRGLDLVPQGKLKLNNKDIVVSGVAVAVTVQKPFAVEVASPKLVLTPGQTVALKGKIVARPVFKEAVQLKLDGLPAGVVLAAPPKAVPPGQSDFQIDLKVDAKAAPATANLTLTCSATIGGMAYNHPPLTVAAEISPTKK